MDDNEITGARVYMDSVRAILDNIEESQAPAIDQTANAAVAAVENDGMIYLFGTGHSHMMAEEGHYRAGGLAVVCPILNTGLMVHESAVTSSKLERLPGIGRAVLERYAPSEKDVLVVFSNSGVNAVPVEVAIAGQEAGMTVVAVVSLAYARQAPLSPLGKRLDEIADIVIDNHVPPGDALVEVGETGLRTGSASTVAGAFVLNAILTETVRRLAEKGITPPVFISANMPNATAHNERLLARYGTRNPHL